MQNDSSHTRPNNHEKSNVNIDKEKLELITSPAPMSHISIHSSNHESPNIGIEEDEEDDNLQFSSNRDIKISEKQSVVGSETLLIIEQVHIPEID
jgi:hypothetical protein